MRKLKYLGHWKEEGYFKRDAILDKINTKHTQSSNLNKKIDYYLTQSCCIEKMSSACLITGIELDSSIMTDGKWVWHKNLWYYYKEKNIALPNEFIKDIEKTSFLFFLLKKWYIKFFKKEEIEYQYIRFIDKQYDITKPLSSPSLVTKYRHIAYFKIEDKNQDHSSLLLRSRIQMHKSDEFQQMMKCTYEIKNPFEFIDFSFSFSAVSLYLDAIKEENHILIKVNILALSPQILKPMLGQAFCISQNIGSSGGLYEEFAILTKIETTNELKNRSPRI